jgi:hypothetical protein
MSKKSAARAAAIVLSVAAMGCAVDLASDVDQAVAGTSADAAIGAAQQALTISLPNLISNGTLRALGLDPTQLPPGPGPACPCDTLSIRPARVPLGLDKFVPGESMQLAVFCGSNEVTRARVPTTFNGLIRAIFFDSLFGRFSSATTYLSQSTASRGVRDVTTVTSDGLVQALAPGMDRIFVNYQGYFLTKVSIRGATFPSLKLCAASGEVPVTVDDQCPPNSCADAGANCGTIADGCGDTLDCGTCPAPQTCGGAGLPNQCGCPVGTIECDGQCVNDSCTGGQSFNAAICECDCPPATIQCNGQCMDASCPEGRTFDDSTCACTPPRAGAYFTVETSVRMPNKNPNALSYSTPNATAGSSSYGARVNSSIGSSQITTTLHVISSDISDVGAGSIISTYVLGPPGTPFQLRYQWTETVSADGSPNAGTNAGAAGFAVISVLARAGESASQTESGEGMVTGATSGPTLEVSGGTYSFAATYGLSGGAGVPPCPAVVCGGLGLIPGVGQSTSTLSVEVLPP